MMLLTGFEPFLNDTINPSQLLVQRLASELSQVRSVVLPVHFENAYSVLNQELLEHKPRCLVMFGQASGRSCLNLEKIALNWIQSDDADASGVIPQTGKIKPQAELALMTAVDVDEVNLHMKNQGFQAAVSFSAGTYVCNNLYYKVLSNHPQIKSLFVHVPCLPEQAIHQNRPSMPFELLYQQSLCLVNYLINK